MIGTIMTLVAAGLLLWYYYRGKIDVAQLIVLGWATQSYNMFIGPTVTPLYIIVQIFLIEEAIRFINKGIRLRTRYVILLPFPIISSLAFLYIAAFAGDIFETRFGLVSQIAKCFAYYIRYYLPYFVVGFKVYRSNTDIQSFYTFVKGVAVVSSVVACIQLLVHVTIGNATLDEIFGLKDRYAFDLAGINFIRVQALFYEPKGLGAFLGIALPLFVRGRQPFAVLFITLVGILTISQTFMSMCLAATIVFLLAGFAKKVRSSLACSLVIMLLIFSAISSAKNYLVENSLSYQQQVLYKIVADRAIQRFANDDDASDFLGIPLQKDLELPIVMFFREHPFVLLSGYGPLNNNLVPDHFFEGQWNYLAKQEGTFKGHVDMGWFFIIFEMGIIAFITIVTVLTKINSTEFNNKYYSFIWMGFFFHRIEFLLIIVFAILAKKYTNEQIYQED